jgi:hypothetical protein
MKGTKAFLATALLAVPLLGGDASFSEDERASFLKAVNSNELATVRTMLERNRTLAMAKTKDGRSAALVALFISGKNGFAGRRPNPVLELLLAESPAMDLFDLAAFGSGPALEELLTSDPAAVRQRSMSLRSPATRRRSRCCWRMVPTSNRAPARNSGTPRCRRLCCRVKSGRRSCSSTMEPTCSYGNRSDSRRSTKRPS